MKSTTSSRTLAVNFRRGLRPMLRFVLVPVFALAPLGLTGCPEKQAEGPKPCCEQPTIPAGMVPFKVVKDDVIGQSDEANVTMRAVLSRPAARQEIYPILHLLYRHAMTRTAFEPINFAADLFKDDASANAGTGNLARIERTQEERAPKCENRVPYTFEQTASIVFGNLFQRKAEEDTADTCRMAESKDQKPIDEGFTHRPAIKIDAAQGSIEVTYPFLEMGKDEYLADLRFTAALKEWMDYTTAMFRKVPDLKHFTFVGIHGDQEALRIALSKVEFETSFAGLQEDIAAHAALTFQKLGMNATNEKAAFKEQEAFYSKTYKEALSRLPKAQVVISKKLK